MTTDDFLEESDVTIGNVAQLFKRAFFKISFDSDGDLVVQTDKPRVVLTLNQNNKLIKLMVVFGFSDSAPADAKLRLVNRLNSEIILARFFVPDVRPDVLAADYFLPYEEGLRAYQLVSALRLFAVVTSAAVSMWDDDNLVE